MPGVAAADVAAAGTTAVSAFAGLFFFLTKPLMAPSALSAALSAPLWILLLALLVPAFLAASPGLMICAVAYCIMRRQNNPGRTFFIIVKFYVKMFLKKR